MVLYTTVCHCLKTLIQPLQALKSLTPNLLATCRTFSLSSEPQIIAHLAVTCLYHMANRLSKFWNGDCFGRFLWQQNLPHYAQQFLASFLFVTIVLMLTVQFLMWQPVQHFSILASPGARIRMSNFSSTQTAFLLFRLFSVKNRSPWQINVKLLTRSIHCRFTKQHYHSQSLQQTADRNYTVKLFAS